LFVAAHTHTHTHTHTHIHTYTHVKAVRRGLRSQSHTASTLRLAHRTDVVVQVHCGVVADAGTIHAVAYVAGGQTT
jgi:hypothetical protein